MEEQNNISQETLEWIEQYLNGTMSSDEERVFATRMESDPVLKKQVQEVQSILKGIEEAALASKLDTFHLDLSESKVVQMDTTKNRSSRSLYGVFGIAASVVAAIGIFWFFKPNPNEKLYKDYYTPDPGLPTVMSTQGNYEFLDGMVNYKREEYQTALQKWQELLPENSKNDTLNYFIGMAFMASEKGEEAAPYLRMVSENVNSVFWSNAQYYRALNAIKDNNLDQAEELLEMLDTANAKELLLELRANEK